MQGFAGALPVSACAGLGAAVPHCLPVRCFFLPDGAAMAAALIAVIIVLVLGHAAPQLATLRHFGWFSHWLQWLARQGGEPLRSRFAVLLSIGLPVLVLGVLQSAVAGHGFGLPAFVLAVLVLFWCWGPRDLDL